MTAALSLVHPGAFPPRAKVHYLRLSGVPDREYFVFCPHRTMPDAEPLVLVHGISRNAAELIVRFSERAERAGVPLVAPLFTQHAYGQYQQVIDCKRGLRSDLALHDILDDAARRFGMDTRRVSLFGFSGGAQFVHRYAMLNARRVRACIPVSAGWYTMPDGELKWPLGLKGMPTGDAVSAARDIPFHVIVGQRDSGNGDALRHDPALDRLQGTDRRARATSWYRALQTAGWNASGSLTILPRTRHNFACAHRRGLTETVFRLLGYEGKEA